MSHDPEKMEFPDGFPDVKPFWQTIGEAMQAYAGVEAALASLLGSILRLDFRRAHAIFFAVQNVRSRNELLGTLLELEFKSDLRKYWDSCSSFILTLAQFRNAIAHWHPHVNIHASATKITRVEHALGHPVLSAASIEKDDFPDFLKDCYDIRVALSPLMAYVKDRPPTLPEILRSPITHQNRAVLQLRPKPKEPQRQRPPSQGKLLKGRKPSARQRRERALRKHGRKT